MNYSGKIFTAAAALVLCCSNIFAQEQNPQDTTAAPKPAISENAPMFRSEGEPRLYYIRDVNVHGVQYLNPEILKSSAGLIAGDSVYLPSNFISNAISRLWSQRFFSDVKIGAEIEGDSLDLEVFLKERPRVYNWEFEGISKGKKKDLLEKLKLKRGSELSDYVIDKNKKLIHNYWAEKGFRNTEVDVRIDNDTLRPGQAVTVTFLIDRKEKVKIGKINFVGNEQFNDKRLRRTFKKTHQKSINFFKGTKLNENDYEADKELLIDFYNSRGYRNATIIRDSIYPINEKRLGIDLSKCRKATNTTSATSRGWATRSMKPKGCNRCSASRTGDIYDKKTMQQAAGHTARRTNPEATCRIKSLYQNERLPDVADRTGRDRSSAPDSIDIGDEGLRGQAVLDQRTSAFRAIMRVNDEVIRRELYTLPGELYNRALLMQHDPPAGSGMGHFDQEKIMPDIKPVSNELVDINWPLEEQASDQFNIAGGWGSGTFVGSVGITLNNLSIKNTFKKGAWRPYPMGQNQRLSLSAQTNGTYYKAFAFSFTDPWMGGKKPNSFTLSAHFSEQNNAYYVWQTSTQYFRTYGVAAGLGKRLNWPDPYFTFYAEASYERYALKNWSSFVMTNGAANLASIKLVFGRNSVDQPIYPRRGSEFSASVQATLPYSLWDGKDYKKLEQIANSSNSTSAEADRANQERYRWVEFHKWQFKAQWFQSLLKNSNLVLMLKAEMGYLGSYNKYKVSPFERYEVGGDGMSGYNIYGIDIIAMRGYEDGALDPGEQLLARLQQIHRRTSLPDHPQTLVADLRAGIPRRR